MPAGSGSRSRTEYSGALRVFYVDDSGNESWSVIAAITFEFSAWPRVLKEWLGWRRWLYKTYSLPTDFEIHAQEFVSGHGEIPPAQAGGDVPEINRKTGLRRQAYRQTLEQLNRQQGVSATTIACEGATVPVVYAEFVERIDFWLGDQGEQGFCIVDGQDDSSYRPAHRALTLRTRHLLEDPLMQSSRHSQLVQAADLAAYAAFQHVAADPDRRFMWEWYPRLLSESFLSSWGLEGLDMIEK